MRNILHRLLSRFPITGCLWAGRDATVGARDHKCSVSEAKPLWGLATQETPATTKLPFFPQAICRFLFARSSTVSSKPSRRNFFLFLFFSPIPLYLKRKTNQVSSCSTLINPPFSFTLIHIHHG
jgi:hypothetical protein